jgi:hypothetical protein
MIAHVVTDYDDENIVEDCETGWTRFCREVLVRTYYHMSDLCRRHRRMGRFGMQPTCRKEWETLRRGIAAYRWVVDGTGGEFTFDQTCRDAGLDPAILRRKLLSQCQPRRDINLLVDWVVRHEKAHESKRRRDVVEVEEGFDLVSAVREFRLLNANKSGRRGAQTHAVCRQGGTE